MERRVFLGNLAALIGLVPASLALPKGSSQAPSYLQMHGGLPPTGAVDAWMLQRVVNELGHRRRGNRGPKEIVAWGKGLGRTVLLSARPPERGEDWLYWSDGRFETDGAGGIGHHGGPMMPLRALDTGGGACNLRWGGRYWGQIVGTVTKRAARVRVVLDMGIAPLDLVPIGVGDRFPVNFYAGFYPQPRKDERPCTWQVVGAAAFDKAGRKVAQLEWW
jgi:hypothetical protein